MTSSSRRAPAGPQQESIQESGEQCCRSCGRSSRRRRARSWWRRRPRQSPADVDPELVGDSHANRLLAGVARLLYGHIAEATALHRPQAASGNERAFEPWLSVESEPLGSLGRGGLLCSADFNEEQFLPRERCCLLAPLRRKLRRPPRVTADLIFMFLQNVANMSQFHKELVVLSGIYVERLLEKNQDVMLSASNWRPLLVAALHLAGKTWQDVHPWNAEVAAFLRRAVGVNYSAPSLYALESRFLSGLGYRVDICAQLYAAYYFSLQDAQKPLSSASAPRGGSMPSSPDVRLLPNADAGASSETPLIVSNGLPRTPVGTSLASSFRTPSGSFFGSGEDNVWSMLRKPTYRSPRYNSFQSTSASSSGSGLSPGSRTTSSISEWPAEVCEESSGSVRQAAHKQMRLDPKNPYIGSLRHAPRAQPPSAYIIPQATPRQF